MKQIPFAFFVGLLLMACTDKSAVVESSTEPVVDTVPNDVEVAIETTSEPTTSQEKEYRFKYNFGTVNAEGRSIVEQWPNVRQINWESGWAEYSSTDFSAIFKATHDQLTHPTIAENHIYHDRACKLRYGYWERILLNLPDASTYEETYDGYLALSEDPETPGLAYLIYQLSRDAENIDFIWMVTKSTLFATISETNYNNDGYGEMVTGLLETYAFLNHDQNATVRLDSISLALNNVVTDVYDYTSQEIPLYTPYIPQSVAQRYDWESFYNGETTAFNSTSIIWFASFWVRRFREGNVETVLSILKEIDDHYAN